MKAKGGTYSWTGLFRKVIVFYMKYMFRSFFSWWTLSSDLQMQDSKIVRHLSTRLAVWNFTVFHKTFAFGQMRQPTDSSLGHRMTKGIWTMRFWSVNRRKYVVYDSQRTRFSPQVCINSSLLTLGPSVITLCAVCYCKVWLNILTNVGKESLWFLKQTFSVRA